MNHTPGPWKVVGNSVYQYYVAGGHEVVDGKSIKGRECCIGRQAASEEIEANTRLIASAPELLEACEAVLQTSLPKWARKRLKDAIAKANDCAI